MQLLDVVTAYLHGPLETEPADVDYKFDVNIEKSQTGYIFLRAGALVSWKSVKQTITTTLTNHFEVLAFHEASRELVWLQMVDRIIKQQAGLEISNEPITIYEYNSSYLNQINAGFIKVDRTKHVNPQIFSYSQDLIESGQLKVSKIKSTNNIADMLTKALLGCTHKCLAHAARMRSYQDLLST